MLQPRSVWHLPPFYDLENLCGIHLELTMDFSSLANTSNFTSIIQGVSHHSLLHVLLFGLVILVPWASYIVYIVYYVVCSHMHRLRVLGHLKTCREPSRDDANWQWIHIIRSSI